MTLPLVLVPSKLQLALLHDNCARESLKLPVLITSLTRLLVMLLLPLSCCCCRLLLFSVAFCCPLLPVRGLFSGVGCSPDGKTAFKSGDVISLSFDLSGIRAVLSFRLNGSPMDSARVEDIKGDVYPAVSVADGAVLQANFGAMPFKYPPPEGFSEVILSQSLI